MDKMQPPTIDRTSALGLFNSARSYWQTAEHVAAAKLNVTHPDAPVIFMHCHATELYLKAYLRGADLAVGDLKTLGHRVDKLAAKADELGLTLELLSQEVIGHIQDESMAIEARYIVTGFKQLPPINALSALNKDLDLKIGKALATRGIPTRELQLLRSDAVPDRLSEIEGLLPYLGEIEREIIAYLLHHKQRLFTAEASGGNARLLLSKGIIQVCAQHGQVIDYEDVPFEVPDLVWKVLLKHRNEFPYNGRPDDPHPWRVDWMSR